MIERQLDNLCDIFLAAAVVCGIMAATVFTIYLPLAVFGQTPRGYFIQARGTGHISEVRQDIRFGPDRVIFIGPNALAWRAHGFLTAPPVAAPKVPDPKDMALHLL